MSEKIKNLDNQKYFSKDTIVLTRLKYRGLSFYKKEYSINLNISLFLSFLTFFLIVFGSYSILSKNAEHSVYLTNVNGQIEKYDPKTEERQQAVIDAYNYRLKEKEDKNGNW